ncbi:cyclic nucleotide-binding domain-containing protein [Myxococcota bacterium]|nr:cyclic nucleotide-binding domain-containing protein [Myxococcota bacterium]
MASALEDLLAKSHVFQRLDADGRARLERIATETPFGAGEIIVHEGDPGDAFYVIVEGTVSVTADDFGTEKEIAELGPGAVCGEIAALTREPRTATMTAKTDAKLLRFEMVAVFAVLKDYPAVLAELNRLGVTRSEDLLVRLGS